MTTRSATIRHTYLVPEQRAGTAVGGLLLPRALSPGPVTRPIGALALTEQLRKETHGRFPSHETGRPVGLVR